MQPSAQTAVIRRSVARGLVAALLTALAASSTLVTEPVELHVVGGSRDAVESTTGASER